MIGLVMAGGQSQRMGSDKGLLHTKAGEIWAKSAWSKLNSCHIPSFVSIQEGQISKYSSYFKPEHFILDDISISVQGPIKGILSAHRRFPHEDVLVLACDMPNMEIVCLQDLIEFQQLHPKDLAWVYQNGVQIEPMCAIYSAQGLAKILELVEKNELPKTSLISILTRLDAVIKPVSEENIPYFLNCNSPKEIN